MSALFKTEHRQQTGLKSMANKLFVTAILAILYCSMAVANETIKMAVGEYPPYTSRIEKNGDFLEKVVTEAFKLESINVEYSHFPWKRSHIAVKNGEYDGTFPWHKTSDRDENFYINRLPLVIDDEVFFHLKSTSFDWESIEDLKDYKVGVMLGAWYHKLYQDKGIDTYSVASDLLNFKMLLAGRIDVYRTAKGAGDYLINNKFSPESALSFTHHTKVIERSAHYILFSKNTPNGKALSEKFDSGLSKLIESGGYDKIASEYCQFSISVDVC